jgi:tripartite-type tricarboxylate transporter receptor subunit TctC
MRQWAKQQGGQAMAISVKVGILALVSVIVSGATAATAQEKGAKYFNGKTVTYIVATGPGGGNDFYGRLNSRHMQRFLPGSKFVVRNMPGAGHIIGTNFIYHAKPNGLTMGTFSTGITYTHIVKRKGVKFDLAKMSWIGKGATDTRVIVASDKSEFKTFGDMLKSKRAIKFGVSGAGSGSFNEAYMISHAFNLPSRVLMGYSGPERAMGMKRGEVDATVGGYSSLREVAGLAGGKIIVQFGTKIPGLPNARDYAKTEMAKKIVTFIEGQGVMYRFCAGPPNIPSDRLEALRDAYMKAYASKELRAEAKRAGRPVDPLRGNKVAAMIKKVVNQPPEVVAFLKKVTSIKPELLKHSGPVTQVKREGRRVVIKYKGKEVRTKISGSRTTVRINGKKTKRKNIKVGMTCTFHYPKPGAESKLVDCKG